MKISTTKKSADPCHATVSSYPPSHADIHTESRNHAAGFISAHDGPRLGPDPGAHWSGLAKLKGTVFSPMMVVHPSNVEDHDQHLISMWKPLAMQRLPMKGQEITQAAGLQNGPHLPSKDCMRLVTYCLSPQVCRSYRHGRVSKAGIISASCATNPRFRGQSGNPANHHSNQMEPVALRMWSARRKAIRA